MVLVMLGQDYFRSGMRMDLMKSWAGIEEEKAGRSVWCVMQSVSHVLWDCPAYASIINLGGLTNGLLISAFMLELRRELGDRFEGFQSLDSFEKSS